MANNKIVKILIYVVLWIAVWALIDWIIAGQNFAFKAWDNLILPAVGGVVFGLLDPFGKKKK